MTRSNEEITKALTVEFPKSAIKYRDDHGTRLPYVEAHTVIRRLIEATDNTFDVAVLEQSIQPNGKTSKGADKFLITARVRLTIPGLGSREHMGVQAVVTGGGEDLAKGAISDAIKKAATLFGVGLELYGPDYEAGEIEDRAVSQRPAPVRHAAQTRQDAPRRTEAPSPHPDMVTDPDALMKRLHAALAKHSITHQDIHDYYAAKGYRSTADVPTDGLARMADWAARADSETVQGEFARVLTSTQATLTSAAPATVSGGAGNDGWTR